MHYRKLLSVVAATFAAIVLTLLPSRAQTVVGNPALPDYANVVFQFSNGNSYWYQYHYTPSPGLTAENILTQLDAGVPSMTLLLDSFGFGQFLDGATIGSDSNIGFADDENWWHFHIGTPGATTTTWTMSMTDGISDFEISNTDWIGFVYGNANAPLVPEPSTAGLLLAAGGAGLLYARRRNNARG